MKIYLRSLSLMLERAVRVLRVPAAVILFCVLLALVFLALRVIFARSVVLGFGFLFFVFPLILRFLFGLLVAALPVFLRGFFSANPPKGSGTQKDAPIDVSYKILE